MTPIRLNSTEKATFRLADFTKAETIHIKRAISVNASDKTPDTLHVEWRVENLTHFPPNLSLPAYSKIKLVETVSEFLPPIIIEKAQYAHLTIQPNTDLTIWIMED